MNTFQKMPIYLFKHQYSRRFSSCLPHRLLPGHLYGCLSGFIGKAIGTLSLTALVGICAASPAGNELIINKKVVSTDIRIIEGRAYAPVADIARALDMNVIAKDGRFEMVRAGGAGEIGDRNSGKLGDVIFSGKWRFQALNMETVETYTPQYNQELDGSCRKPRTGEKLIVVHCRLKNGTSVKASMGFFVPLKEHSNHDYPEFHTALTDADEQSIAPLGVDVHTENVYYGLGSASFLPGAAISFNLIFSVPPATQPKSLLFSATHLKDSTRIDKNNITDFRVSLNR